MKKIKDYFIGELLGEDYIQNSKVTILFNVILLGSLLTYGIGVMGFLLGTPEIGIRALLAATIMILLSYVIKWKKSIVQVAHILVLLMTLTILTNIFIIFQKVDYSTLSIFFVSGIFSFLFLSSRWAMLHTSTQLIGLLCVMWFKLGHFQWTSIPPKELRPFEQNMAYIIIMILILYILWTLQSANENFARKLKEKNKELEGVNENLTIAKEKAEEMNRLKTNFLANMSHEVRTPINGIIGLSDIIERELTDEELKKMVRMQKESSTKLLNTITGILDLSRMESEKNEIVLEDVNLAELVKESFTLLRPIAINKGITFEIKVEDKPLICLATEAILHQIFNNIIGNAIKFTQEGAVTISITSRKNMSITTVRDTGIGIAKEFIPNVFNSFEREDQQNGAKFEGTGLGLAISHKYIMLIGGEIYVTSKKGEGSEFVVKIPMV